MCTTLNCDNEIESLCSFNNSIQCQDPLTYSFCPSVCGYDKNSSIVEKDCKKNSTDIVLNNQTTIAMGCKEILNCKNNGVFNNISCSCVCFPIWAGPCKNKY